MGCVNKSSSEFKQLAAKHNVDSNTLEHITHKYWIETKNETLFPTDVYIQKQLGQDEYLENVKPVRELWKLKYSSPQEFSSMEALQSAYKKATRFFPLSAITYYRNGKGNFTLNVRKPVKTINHSKEKFFADYDSSRGNHAYNLDIEENQSYGIDKVQQLFNRFNSDRTTRDLADRVFSLAKNLNLMVRFSDSETWGSKLGTYSNTNGILYNKSFLENPSMDGKKANVLLHEAIHAISMYALSNQIDSSELSQPIQQFREEITSLFNKLKDNKELKGERGIVNAKEFVAELGNPAFREKLKAIDKAAKENKKISLWQKVINAFKRLFNLHVTNSYYQRSMNALDKAISAFDVDTYMRYTGIKNFFREEVSNSINTQYNKSLSVINNAAKSGEWTSAALTELNNLINDIENGKVLDQRFPQEASRGSYQGGRANETASLLLRASESSSTKNTRSFSERYAEEKRQQPVQEIIKFVKSLSPQQLRDETNLIKQESADYDTINGIEHQPQRAERTGPQNFTFEDGTTIMAPFKPNEQQREALNAMDRFIKSSDTSMTLSGYAGTGKTSLMEMIAKKCRKQGRLVMFCATTNKAAAVLDSRVSKAGFQATTLNKVFGINVEVDSNQKSYNARNLVNVLKDVDIIPGTTIIIDEASMINEENYKILNDIAKHNNLKIIYVGDAAQLAPVNEEQISKVFRNGEGKIITLTQVERTDDNAILKEATNIRNNKPLSGESSFNSKGEGVAYISPQHKEDINKVIAHYVPGLRKDSNYFRILAYTNKAVTNYNTQVRTLLGYNSPVPQVGESMTGYANWGYDWRSKSYRFINSESYKVTKVGSPTPKYISLDNDTNITMEAVPLTLVDPMGKVDTFNFMDIKGNAQNRQAAMLLAEEKKRLWAMTKRAVGKAAKARLLQSINALDSFLFVNDNLEDNDHNLLQAKTIDFGYALTIHKSQGSTFTNVLMDDVDVSKAAKNNSFFEAVDLGSLTSNPLNAELKSVESVDLGDLSNVALKTNNVASSPSKSNVANIKQQLEYVGVSRATDTVTIVSNNVKKEDSPLNHLHSETKPANSTINPPVQRSTNEVTKQLTDHLKSIGINVLDRTAMQKFFEEHPDMAVQMAGVFGKENPYLNSKYRKQKSDILSIIKANKYSKAGTDAITLDSDNHKVIYLIDHSADNELTNNLKKGDGFGIRAAFNVNKLSKDDCRTIIRNLSSDFGGSEATIRRKLQSLGITAEHLFGIDIAAELKMGTNANDSMVSSGKGKGFQADNNRRGTDGRESEESSRQKDRVGNDGIEFFLTPQGEVYSFVDKAGNIYLDETKISPEHPIHEYTHLWDRAVAEKNPELWKRGIELLKETPLWGEILDDPNYGKKWLTLKGMPQEKLVSLIASEAHARLTGKNGASILEDIAKQKGKQGIVSKLKQWLLDFWRNLKGTFTPWSEDEINHLTLEDFNNMTLRDFSEGINPLTANNNTTNNNNNETRQYKQTDEFRRVQEASRKLSEGKVSSLRKRLSDDDKRRLGGVLGRQLVSASNGGRYSHRSSLTYTNEKKGLNSKFDIGTVDGSLFHDIFEIVRTYLPNGELVDLHDDYSDCKCFVTSDGLAGFAIEPDGNLVSVYSLNPKDNGGFLYAIRDLIRQEGATHLDAYANSNQPLQEIYAKTIGFHTASTMDYNMEYDHDDIAKNHGNPPVVFMVDHEVAEPKHFDKDSYDAAQQYQLDQLKDSKQPSAANDTSINEESDSSSLSSLPKTESIEVSLPNYETYVGIDSSATVDAEWKIPYLQELDSQFTGNGEEDSPSNKNILNQMKQVFQATSEKEYLSNENNPKRKAVRKTIDNYKIFNEQLDNLLEGTNEDLQDIDVPRLKASEVRHVAELVMNFVSDEITRLQTEIGYAEESYPLVKTDLDFRTASRRKIANTIGLDNLLSKAKRIFNTEDSNCTLEGDETFLADLIYDNWDALVSLGSDIFTLNEGYGFSEDFYEKKLHTTEGQKVGFDNFNNNNDDPDAAAEVSAKDEQERWMVEMRTIDVLNSMSDLVRQGLRQCYLLNEDGSKVMSRWGIAERVNPRKVTNSILRWTQGSLSLDDMIQKLSEKSASNPWLSQLIERLSDKSGKETDFQSQFYGVFSKHFQLYSVVLQEDGKYYSKIVNSHPALTDTMNSIVAKYKIGEHPLFYSDGRINTNVLGSDETINSNKFNLHKALTKMEVIRESIRRNQAFDSEMSKEAIDIVADVCRTFGWDVSKDLVSEAMNNESFKTFYTNLKYTVKDLDKAVSKQGKNDEHGKSFNYDPFGYQKDSNIRNSVQNFIVPITDILEDTAVTAFYNSGKMYQSYVIPSFLTKLMQKFSSNDEEFQKFMQEEYASSEWFAFKEGRNIYYRTPWLRKLQNPEMRKKFAHKVELNFNQHDYMRNMSDAEYTLSLITEYFSESSDSEKDLAASWYRIPMQSNKPSSDFIRFISYRGRGYKDSVVRDLHDMFLQELSRIQTVRRRNLSEGDDGFIENFDKNGRKFCFLPVFNTYLEDNAINKKKRLRLHNGVNYDAERLEALQAKLDSYNIAASDLTKQENEFYSNGTPVDLTEGDPFKAERQALKELDLSLEERDKLQKLKELRDTDNRRLSDVEDDRFSNLLQKKIKGEEPLSAAEEIDLGNIADKILYQFTENRVQSILDSWERSGIIESAKSIKGMYSDAYKNNDNDRDKVTSIVRKKIENFLWNDSLASKNILQLTVTDIAFYKDTENLQKRLSQLHAPGTRGNKYAVDYNGDRVSDGIYRTFILKDFDSFISNIIANISEVFDRKILEADDDQKAALIALKESLVGEDGEYRQINVTDAQGYSSPSSYRKKALIFGRWSKESERVYQGLLKGDFSDIAAIKKAFQPLKPFVYSKLTKNMGVENAPIHTMPVPFQAKNAEYLLVMADALLQGERTSRPNLLRAVYRIMEDSEKINPTKGIDTVQFESAIKSGLQSPMDISQFLLMKDGEKEAYSYMKNRIFKEEYVNNERVYKNYDSDSFVHEASYDDYCLQQEIPEHFKDHSQSHGSQIRMITPSDLDFYSTELDEEGHPKVNYYPYKEADGTVKHLTADEIREEYERTNAENIEESINDLAAELHINSEDIKERNIAISKILQQEISSSPRYGVELLQACSIDAEGNFRIPKGDPIQAKRIEQLINSVIKNRINKQKIAGGPIVQVSNFGTSRQLNIRFNDRQGNLMPLESEYNPAEHDGKSYKEYIKENQGGIAYFEVFAPVPSEEIQQKFGLPDGSINIQAIEATDPELLKMVSYRIPTEDKYSCAPMKIVGFMPKWAGDAIMLPYELTSIDDSDFDVDKRYVMRKEIDIKTKRRKDIESALFDNLSSLVEKRFGRKDNKWVGEQVKMFMDNPQKMKNMDNLMRYLWKKYQSVAYETKAPLKGRKYRNNKIVDMTYAILSNEMTADKILNPGGFAGPKRMGYMIAAYKNHAADGMLWDSLQSKGTGELKDLSYTDKDLTFADTQVQFYRQNAAAASLIGVFAVNKVAHAVLESNGFFIDIAEACGVPSFSIAGMNFDHKIELDVRYDRDGNLVGKTLGSLVSASADAVKDPILNLMNVNMTTANILNTLLRLGMPFNDAALFLSQDVITRLIDVFNRENLSNSVSLSSLIDKWLDSYAEAKGYNDSSAINSQPLSKEELIEGLTSEKHEEIDYKVLLAYKRLQAITEVMRKPTFATRFNSVSSAVGPLIIDNLITDKKIANFLLKDSDDSTGLYVKGENDDWMPADINTVFHKHPILQQFARANSIARNVFSDMPAGSDGFRKVLVALPDDISSKVYADKKLLDQLSMFYQSYLLVQSGVINASHLKDCIENFPKEFISSKYKEKYPDNALIQAIRVKVPNGSKIPYLTLNFTGMDEQQKEELRYAWIDLHVENPELSRKLFEYSFFLGGVGFSPKTLMALVPLYVKERIKSEEGSASYVDTYRNFPDIVPDTVVDQFIRNNWNNNKLVPWKGGKDSHFRVDVKGNKELVVYDEKDLSDVANTSYMKVKVGNDVYLWKLSSVDENTGSRTYRLIKPLGDNGNYLEINTEDIVNPVSITSSVKEDNSPSQLETQSPIEDNAESTSETPAAPASELIENFEGLIALIRKKEPSWSDERVINRAEAIAKGRRLYGMYLQKLFRLKGLTLNMEEAIKESEKYC